MNREILFRGKRTDDGRWNYGVPVKADGGDIILVGDLDGYQTVYELYENAADVIPETVGQYTGLTDKNVKKIFEGDIVTGLFLFGLSVNAVVTFQDGAFGLEWHRGNAKTFNAFTSICNVEYEVIGNIHDNPELLKGE